MRVLAYLALVGFAAFPTTLGAQEIPDALKDKALIVRVTAIVPAEIDGTGETTGSETGTQKAQDWEAESSKGTVPGTPVHFKLVGANVAIIVQITPFEAEDGKGVTLIAQGQVWIKPPEGGLSYHTNIDTLSVEYGETVLFFPLGRSPGGDAPMRLEISVVRASDLDSKSHSTGDKPAK